MYNANEARHELRALSFRASFIDIAQAALSAAGNAVRPMGTVECNVPPMCARGHSYADVITYRRGARDHTHQRCTLCGTRRNL